MNKYVPVLVLSFDNLCNHSVSTLVSVGSGSRLFITLVDFLKKSFKSVLKKQVSISRKFHRVSLSSAALQERQ